ncbi:MULTISPECIES: type II toxin-antitoxin system VapC family toxin [unclassified Rhizobium]|jgi:ribonuclease VapC|uniref:type II toxin-antitoxin system VapC family toxin n=1 Tax=unclassified Rhizobium TaxID=2613769 RepID=UPI000DBFF773|nr:type II toxin-antitoxin system VapC family toxin [Rhizobium sp. AN80A]
MIAVDTSVIIAIAADEPEAEVFRPLIGREPVIIGWPTLLEVRPPEAGIDKSNLGHES